MICWRLCKREWAGSAFSGIWAAEFPGRWNSAGTRVVYCADSLSLAALEALVHVEDKTILSQARFAAFEVSVPDRLVHVPPALPPGWNQTPLRRSVKEFGDRFLYGRKAPVMRVSSAVVPNAMVYLINPLHPDFPRITIGKPVPFRFAPRLYPKPRSA
jgi:RES domain-containing protein